MLPTFALRRISLIFERAEIKYGEHGGARNYEKGMPLSEFMCSAKRHIDQYIEGRQDGEDHLGQAAWNLLAALQIEEMMNEGLLPWDLDDLPHYFEAVVDGES